MIVAGSQGFMKAHYRTFNIKSEELSPGDDYGMMREVLKRRFTRLVKENPRGASGTSRAGRSFGFAGSRADGDTGVGRRGPPIRRC